MELLRAYTKVMRELLRNRVLRFQVWWESNRLARAQAQTNKLKKMFGKRPGDSE